MSCLEVWSQRTLGYGWAQNVNSMLWIARKPWHDRVWSHSSDFLISPHIMHFVLSQQLFLALLLTVQHDACMVSMLYSANILCFVVPFHHFLFLFPPFPQWRSQFIKTTPLPFLYLPILQYVSLYACCNVLPASLCVLQSDVVISQRHVGLLLTVSVSSSFTMKRETGTTLSKSLIIML